MAPRPPLLLRLLVFLASTAGSARGARRLRAIGSDRKL
uniref:NHD1 n=1 Tax=Arundo donax TaxID=35708 RepID=A0A0A9FVW7_ARUDO